MPEFDTPLGLRSSRDELWNISIDETFGSVNGNLTLSANRVTGGNIRMAIDDDTGNVGISTTAS